MRPRRFPRFSFRRTCRSRQPEQFRWVRTHAPAALSAILGLIMCIAAISTPRSVALAATSNAGATTATAIVAKTAAAVEILERPAAALEHLFSRIPPGAAPSGVLYDRALGLSRIEELDGSSGAPAISAARWRQLYFELRRSSDDPSRLPKSEFLRQEAASSRPGDAIPIAVLDYGYDRLREDALERDLAQIDDGRLSFRPGALESKRVFAAAAMREISYHGARAEFTLSSRWRFSNLERQPHLNQIDADDGRGFREIPVNGHFNAHYAADGRKMLRLRTVYMDGSVAEAAFTVQVAALETPAPDDTLQLTASIPYEGEVAQGEAYLYLADNHATVTQPMVMVEGFDLDNDMNWHELYALLNAENLLEDLRAAGYDIVVLNFADATDYIQRNSTLVVELIQKIQQRIAPQTHFMLTGASMGALCCRFALAFMEENDLECRVDTYLSFDGPHQGANIPLGLQYWLDFFSDDSEDAAHLLSRLDRPAARQLLVYHHTTPPTATAVPDSLRGVFLDDLTVLGDYPTQLRMVAIANGSGMRQDQGFPGGTQIIQWEYDSWLIDIRGNVWAVTDGSSQQIFEGLINPILIPTTSENVTVSGTELYDNAPGGWRASMAQADSSEAPYGDIIALYDNHCFIPTVSALDLDVGNLFYDIAGNSNLAALTPFDAVYFPTGNQEHVAVTTENAAWIKAELFATPTATPPPTLSNQLALLRQNVPNPFNPRTSILLDVFQPARVRLDVFDLRGRRIRNLLDAQLPPGQRVLQWDGFDQFGRQVGSGVYLLKLQAGNETQSRRMVLLR